MLDGRQTAAGLERTPQTGVGCQRATRGQDDASLGLHVTVGPRDHWGLGDTRQRSRGARLQLDPAGRTAGHRISNTHSGHLSPSRSKQHGLPGTTRIGGCCRPAQQRIPHQLLQRPGQCAGGKGGAGQVSQSRLHGWRQDSRGDGGDETWHHQQAGAYHQAQAWGDKAENNILDLRRSGGNKKATLPEKLVLPRPRDFLNSIRSVYSMQRAHGRDEGYTRELAVIDVSDAFMSLAVEEKELPHTLAPNIENEDFYMFVALLFGYKTAPLLWSRVAALLSRLIQSVVPGAEGQHQTYLDDAAWVLQGSLVERNSTLAFILYTMAALGFRISLQKGMRSTQVTWVGVRFTVTPENVIIGLPEKFITELVELLESWHNKGMVAIKELRQAAGRISWMSGILPRTRWVVATFYKVLHERLNDIASGAEAIRRSNRSDTRAKDHLFTVKQLEQPRQWLVTYLKAALLKPTRKYKLDIEKYPKATIVTDASPLGLGAILLVNNKATRALAFKVTETDAHQLGFKECWKEAGSQGVVETLAVLVALKTWTKELASCQVELKVQSDSMVALAVTQKLSNSTSTLNFLVAEIAVQCEIAGVGLQIGLADLRRKPILQCPRNWKGCQSPGMRSCGWRTITSCQHPPAPLDFGFPALQPMTYGLACAEVGRGPKLIFPSDRKRFMRQGALQETCVGHWIRFIYCLFHVYLHVIYVYFIV